MFLKILKREYTNNYGRKRLLTFRAMKWYILEPNYRVIVLIRYYINIKSSFFKKLIRNKLSVKYSVEIGIAPVIGSNFSIEHFQSIIIGNKVKIGNNVTLYQDVTLGQKKGKYPIIKDNVIIYSGAKVIGDIVIGENSVIGANAVVIKDVPANSVVAGVPGKIVKKI